MANKGSTPKTMKALVAHSKDDYRFEPEYPAHRTMTKNNLKILIFDMDGVILDSEPLHEIARQRMFGELGIVPDETFPEAVGKSASGYWRQIVKICGLNNDPYTLEARQYHLVAQQIKESHVPPSAGLPEVLKWAKMNKIKIGLASSSNRTLVDEALAFLGIREYFDYTVSGNEVKTKKPAPDVYLKVLEMAGIAPEYAAAVEDSRAGVEAAQSAGIFCYGYKNPTSGGQNVNAADEVIEHLSSIIQEKE